MPEEGTVRIDDWSRFGYELLADPGSVRTTPATTAPSVAGGRTREALASDTPLRFDGRIVGATGSEPAAGSVRKPVPPLP